jgi:hypothetical protein
MSMLAGLASPHDPCMVFVPVDVPALQDGDVVASQIEIRDRPARHLRRHHICEWVKS